MLDFVVPIGHGDRVISPCSVFGVAYVVAVPGLEL